MVSNIKDTNEPVAADWQAIKKGLESIKHGKLSIWKYPFK